MLRFGIIFSGPGRPFVLFTLVWQWCASKLDTNLVCAGAADALLELFTPGRYTSKDTNPFQFIEATEVSSRLHLRVSPLDGVQSVCLLIGRAGWKYIVCRVVQRLREHTCVRELVSVCLVLRFCFQRLTRRPFVVVAGLFLSVVNKRCFFFFPSLSSAIERFVLRGSLCVLRCLWWRSLDNPWCFVCFCGWLLFVWRERLQ